MLMELHEVLTQKVSLQNFAKTIACTLNKLMKQMQGRPSTKGDLWLQHLPHLYDEQWANFCKFYKTTSKGILRNRDVVGEFMSPL